MVLILDANSDIGTTKEQSLLFDLFKANDEIESSQKSDYFTIILHACATCSYFRSNISTMIYVLIFLPLKQPFFKA